jgi:two-component system response regulator FixJ
MSVVAKGHPNKIAGQNPGISPRTIELHRARIMGKLQASGLSDLVRL